MKRLNGDSRQKAVPRRLLKEYIKKVKGYRKGSADQAAEGWRDVDALWPTMIEEARTYLLTNPDPTHRSTFSATSKALYRAHEEIARLGHDAIDGRDVTHTVLALYLMRWTSNDIVTDDALIMQLARAVKKLGTVGLGSYRDRQGRLRQGYRVTPRRAMMAFGHLIRTAYGPSGIAIVKAEQQENAVDPDKVAANRAYARAMLDGCSHEDAMVRSGLAMANDNVVGDGKEDVA